MSRLLTISEAEIEEMSSVLQSRVVTEVVSQVQGMLKQLGSVTLNIAVTGESGSGKSSFVNVFRGVADDSAGAAQTGVTETTSEAVAYTHPIVPTITLWDLPGIGTPAFKPETYLEQVGFLQYDFFIIVGAERFRDYHIQLASAIRQAGKRLYFVRNKVDSDLEASFRRRSGKGLTEADILSQIRADCEVNLKKAGVEQAKVFLLSCFQPQSFDFHILQTTIEKELEGHKRHVFLMSLPNLSSAIIESKKTALAGTVWKRAIEACLTAVTGDTGHDVVSLLLNTLISYQQNFGLDADSLHQLAALTGNTYQVLFGEVHSTIGREISELKVQGILSQVAAAQQTFTSLLEKRIPVLGTVASGGVTFTVCYYLLISALNDLSEDAERVIGKALGTSVTE